MLIDLDGRRARFHRRDPQAVEPQLGTHLILQGQRHLIQRCVRLGASRIHGLDELFERYRRMIEGRQIDRADPLQMIGETIGTG